jgi:hypothetical protein
MVIPPACGRRNGAGAQGKGLGCPHHSVASAAQQRNLADICVFRGFKHLMAVNSRVSSKRVINVVRLRFAKRISFRLFSLSATKENRQQTEK